MVGASPAVLSPLPDAHIQHLSPDDWPAARNPHASVQPLNERMRVVLNYLEGARCQRFQGNVGAFELRGQLAVAQPCKEHLVVRLHREGAHQLLKRPELLDGGHCYSLSLARCYG